MGSGRGMWVTTKSGVVVLGVETFKMAERSRESWRERERERLGAWFYIKIILSSQEEKEEDIRLASSPFLIPSIVGQIEFLSFG